MPILAIRRVTGLALFFALTGMVGITGCASGGVSNEDGPGDVQPPQDEEPGDGSPGTDRCAPGLDADGDGRADDVEGCDVCLGHNDGIDTDGDGIPNGCDVCGDGDDANDADGDGEADACDLCPNVADQDDGADVDGDSIPDACDVAPPPLIFAEEPILALRMGESNAAQVPNNLVDTTTGYPDAGFNRVFEYGSQTTVRVPGMSKDGDTAVYFDDRRPDSYLMLSPAPAEFPTTALTLMTWVHLDIDKDDDGGLSDDTHVLASYAAGTGANANEVELRYAGNRLRLYIGNLQRDTNDNNTTPGALSVPNEEWHHVAVTWSQAEAGATNVAFYVDGVLRKAYANHQRAYELSPNGSWSFGKEQSNVGTISGAAMRGRMDEVYLFSKALDGDTIQAFYDADRGEIGCGDTDGQGNILVDPGFFGSGPQCPALDCADLLAKVPSAVSGDYYIDPDVADDNTLSPFLATCDMETQGGGWTMVLNYVHRDGTNPGLIAPRNSLPLLRGVNLSERGDTFRESWGHGRPGDDTVMEVLRMGQVRWYGVTEDHNRVLHFIHASEEQSAYLSTGSGSFWEEVAKPEKTTLLPDHTANLPLSVNDGLGNRGNDAMTERPFFYDGSLETDSNRYEWKIRGGNGDDWAMDNNRNDPNADTIHRVWVRPTPSSN